jgi:hypothetical protein
MKKIIYILGLVMIMASCSNQRYAHLSKVKSDHRSEKMQATGKKYPEPILIESKSSAVSSNSKKLFENAPVKFIPPPVTLSTGVAAATKPMVTNEQGKKASVLKAEFKKKATEVNKKKPFDHYARKDDGAWDIFSILSFGFGIIGILAVPILFGILAIIFGAIGLSRTKNGARRGRGFAIAGFVLGLLVFFLLFLLFGLLLAVAL